jgi:hypothetical protein
MRTRGELEERGNEVIMVMTWITMAEEKSTDKVHAEVMLLCFD